MEEEGKMETMLTGMKPAFTVGIMGIALGMALLVIFITMAISALVWLSAGSTGTALIAVLLSFTLIFAARYLRNAREADMELTWVSLGSMVFLEFKPNAILLAFLLGGLIFLAPAGWPRYLVSFFIFILLIDLAVDYERWQRGKRRDKEAEIP